jgi:hypothetical protein
MKPGRLARKTHLKRHASLPAAVEAAVIDMAHEGEAVMLAAPASLPAIPVIDLTADAPVVLRPLAEFIADTAGPADIDVLSAQTDRFQTEDDIFSWCAAVLAESPAAGRLLAGAAAHGWSIGLAELGSGGFYLDSGQRHVLLDRFSMHPLMLGRSVYFRNALLTTLIRALRDIWHEENDPAFESDYRPEHVLMLERIRAADCDTVTIQAGWELRGAGFTDVWRHILGSEEGDMALVFTRYLERDPGAMFDGAALACTFRQWYADHARVNACDHETLEALDDILLGGDAHNPFGARDLIAATVEALAVLPDGLNYLAGLGRTILADPVFAGLHDAVNQAHLFHLMYDMEVTMVNNVPFRDSKLARRIFPQAENIRTWR